MAHQLTAEQVDAQAAAIAAGEAPAKQENLDPGPPTEPILAVGASGETVQKLVNLLAVLGYTSNDVIKGGTPRLDESVLVDVRAAQQALDVVEPPVEAPIIEGELVGPSTWAALYEAAAAKLEQPAAGGAESSA